MQKSGIIIRSVRGLYTVASPDGISEYPARGNLRKQGIQPCVGDHVQVEECGISKILPRKNEITRPFLANLDQICFVVSTCEPSPNLRVLDKFLAVAAYKDISPLILLTKVDLEEGEPVKEIYGKAGIPLITVDYRYPETLETVREALAGKVSALTGNSGSGKSTLLNALDSRLHIPTGEISQKLGRGRHTTRYNCLYPVQGGGFIADTPGFSSFDTAQYALIRKEDVASCFVEFAPYMGKCRFHDCAHIGEQGCAVMEAVKAGYIPPSRHESYLAMYEEAKQIKEWEH